MKHLLLALLFGASAVAGISATQVSRKNNVTNTTTAWGTLVTAMPREVNNVDIYNSSTSGTLVLGLGVYGSEYQVLLIPPNTNKVVPLTIHRNTQVNIKAKDLTVSAGEFMINFME